MASNFNMEIESILVALKGSPWATDATVHNVIEEYSRLVDASKRLRHRERKPALQILFSSRAIDTLLNFVVNRYRVTCGKKPHNDRITIGPAVGEIQPLIHPFVFQDLVIHVKDKRNKYLHQAGVFPSDEEMELFLLATAIGISELINSIP